jgi:hypothetical protein
MWRSPVVVLQLLLVLLLLPSLAAAASSSSAAAGVTTKGETTTRRQRGLSSSPHAGFRGLADRSTRNDDDDEPSLKSPPKKSETKKKREKKEEEELPEVAAPSIAATMTSAPSPAPKAKPTGAVMTYVETHETVVAGDLESLEEKVEHTSWKSRIITLLGLVVLVLGCGYGYKYYQDRQSASGPVYTTIP